VLDIRVCLFPPLFDTYRDADLMLAGSADAAVLPSGIGGFIACKALSKRCDDPASASRPWDKNRDGFVMGEGGGEWPGQEWRRVGWKRSWCVVRKHMLLVAAVEGDAGWKRLYMVHIQGGPGLWSTFLSEH
jgi:hypothetical protein